MSPSKSVSAPTASRRSTAGRPSAAGRGGSAASTERGAAAFDTALGRCALAWGPAGVLAVRLPGARPESALAELCRELRLQPAEPTPEARDAMERIAAHLAGKVSDLLAIRLDLAEVPEFHRRVYERARRVASGCTTSYGELAREVGSPGAARAVGQAMAKNPFPVVVPCHRVLARGGLQGGFSAYGGLKTKEKLLRLEGATLL